VQGICLRKGARVTSPLPVRKHPIGEHELSGEAVGGLERFELPVRFVLFPLATGE
jgi:hypothetical protein